ncbi:hypothetical protein JR316_0011198 [Psilocybe cubensis]|uniref:Uncharacterized protein n=1 Tax=Psilocybe cubensis TaxID=181762 RepID=A0ACB8GJ45_PSICU|nr:hypothetical protein JR316_0011198 [Psilocybe cubensis]KAH9475643.1 hypothetical protein JR316_0011198 [Psilocybe cubensis]
MTILRSNKAARQVKGIVSNATIAFRGNELTGNMSSQEDLFADFVRILEEIEIEWNQTDETFYQSAEEDSDEIEPKTITNTMTKDLPAAGERGAPKFIDTEPEELLRFLEAVDELYKKCEITNDNDKKKAVGKYVSAQTEAQWKAFKTYKTGTWEEFKTEVTASYPEVVLLERGSITALDKLCRKYSRANRIEASDITGLAALIRCFRAEAGKLTEDPPLVSNRDLVDRFLDCLTPEFATRIEDKLDTIMDARASITDNAGTNARWEDRYTLQEVINMAQGIAERSRRGYGIKPAENKGNRRGYGDEELVPNQKGLETYVKLEEQMAQLIDTITNAEKRRMADYKVLQESQNRQLREMQQFLSTRQTTPGLLPNNSYAPSRYRDNPNTGCHYCKEDSHRIIECPYVRKHLEAKWIIKNAENHIRLPNGAQIYPDGNKSRKEVVENMNKSKGMAATMLQEERESPAGEVRYKLHRQYELAKSLQALTEDFGEDALEAVLEERQAFKEMEEEEPRLENFQ